MKSPGDPTLTALLHALTQAGAVVAVVGADGRVVAEGVAARLGDLPALARAAAAAPITVSVGGASYELRTVTVGGDQVVVGTDVTARADLAGLDEFLSYASHELKGPLHVLGLACHLIDARTARGDRIEPANVDQIRRQLGRLTRQINQLLDVGRLRQGRVELVLEKFDLAAIARAGIAEVEDPRAAEVKVFAPAGPVEVYADAMRATEMIEGLIDNAIRFTPAGSAITVLVEDAKGQARVIVTDDGPGIPAADLASLFDVGAPRQPRRGRVGLGLGLGLGRAIARLQGGDLEYRPGAPKGTCVVLSLKKA